MMNENTHNVVPCTDYAAMADIWLEASSQAHCFIPREYWVSNAEAMRSQYLPASENYAYAVEDGIAGFISLNGGHIEALFVSPAYQGMGIGKTLLDKAKELHRRLTLAVYSENVKAAEFYYRNGFRVATERVDQATGHLEKVMLWQSGVVPAE